MANSRYEYVKQYELPDHLLPTTYLVVRIDGVAFHRFTTVHQFRQPNDLRGLRLMNHAAAHTMQRFKGDIILAIGHSDEMSFVTHPHSVLYQRRAQKLNSVICSTFTSAYIYHWSQHFDTTPLQYPPVFDSRVVCMPNDAVMRDYLSWRQVDYHINNLYNACYALLTGVYYRDGDSDMTRSEMDGTQYSHVEHRTTPAATAGASADRNGAAIAASDNTPTHTQPAPRIYTPIEAEHYLRTHAASSGDKNELLFSTYHINYNTLPAMYRKGSVLIWINEQQYTQSTSSSDEAPVMNDANDNTCDAADVPNGNGTSTSEHNVDASPHTDGAIPSTSAHTASAANCASTKTRTTHRRHLVILHEDIIGDAFWLKHPGLIPYMSHTQQLKEARKLQKQEKRRMMNQKPSDAASQTSVQQPP